MYVILDAQLKKHQHPNKREKGKKFKSVFVFSPESRINNSFLYFIYSFGNYILEKKKEKLVCKQTVCVFFFFLSIIHFHFGFLIRLTHGIYIFKDELSPAVRPWYNPKNK